MLPEFIKQLQMLSRRKLAVGAALTVLAGAALYGFTQGGGGSHGSSGGSSQSRKGLQRYTPAPAEWATLTIQPVTSRRFPAHTVTEGKVSSRQHKTTPG